MEQLQRSLVNTHELLRKLRSRWLSHALHDLRGPLFTARGYTNLLLGERAGKLTVTQRRYVDVIIESLNKLASSVEAMRDLPSTDGLDLEIIDLTELLHSAVNDCQLSHKTLHIETHIPPVALYTAADRAKLSLAVYKLLGTTVEISWSEGKIDFCVHHEEEEVAVRISVPSCSSGSSSEDPSLPDISMPCSILRLHGGSASAGYNRCGGYQVTLRIPIVLPDSGQPSLA